MKNVIRRGVLVASACAVLALTPLAEASPILEINGAGKLVGGGALDFDSVKDLPTPQGLINQIGMGRFDEVGLVFRFGDAPDILTGQGLLRESVNTSSTSLSTLSSDLSPAVVTPVPEPASLLLLATGIAGVARMRRRR